MVTNTAALKKLLELKNISISELADQCAISQPHASDIANGKKQPSRGVLELMASVLEVEPSALIAPDSINLDAWPHGRGKRKKASKKEAAFSPVKFLNEKLTFVGWLRARDEISAAKAESMRAGFLAEALRLERELAR
jgi:transcriptional regulator with XRE-family HTH domain